MMPRARHLSPLLLLALAACPGDADRAERREAAQAQRGGTITVVDIADLDKPMPLIFEGSIDQDVGAIVFRQLLAPRWEDGELTYVTHDVDATSLAQRWEYVGPDSASIRYVMRSDALWSDGERVTAHDVKWTIDTQGDPRTASPRQDFNRQIREVVVEDDTTVVVHFTRRYPDMLFHSAGNVAPRHVFEGTDPAQLRNHPAVTDPVANGVFSGAYVISEWQRGQRFVLTPNPHFQPQPNIQRVVFRSIPEQTTRMIELQTGNVDVMNVPFDQLENVQRTSPHIRFERRERRFYDYISYSPQGHPAFADRNVRRALGLAIDVDGLIRALHLEEYAEAAGGPYSPIFRRLYDPQEQAPLPFDPEGAARLLDEAGWVAGPDGIRSRGGRALRFTLTTNAGNQRRADIAQIVQQQWRRVGVDARIQILETHTFFDRLSQRNFEASVGGWGVGLSPDLTDLWTGDTPFNHTGFSHPEVDRNFELALQQPTEEAAAAYWRRAAALIVAEQPYTWLYYFDQLYGVSRRIRNTRIDTLGTFQNIHEWWIPEEHQSGPAADRG
jgi:peptide/nickel transport system substrate-binding protein